MDGGKNNMVSREEKKLFYYENLDGTKEYYYLTFGELLDTFGERLAIEIWERGAMPDDY